METLFQYLNTINTIYNSNSQCTVPSTVSHFLVRDSENDSFVVSRLLMKFDELLEYEQ